jgi:hypothetical protein
MRVTPRTLGPYEIIASVGAWHGAGFQKRVTTACTGTCLIVFDVAKDGDTPLIVSELPKGSPAAQASKAACGAAPQAVSLRSRMGR